MLECALFCIPALAEALVGSRNEFILLSLCIQVHPTRTEPNYYSALARATPTLFIPTSRDPNY